MQLSLPGAVYLYNGDELGLPNVELPDSALQDPIWRRSGGRERGRDGERVPLPWGGTAPPFDFSTAPLHLAADAAGMVGADDRAQSTEARSTLRFYRRALALRRSSTELHEGDFDWIDAPPDCLSLSPRIVLHRAAQRRHDLGTAATGRGRPGLRRRYRSPATAQLSRVDARRARVAQSARDLAFGVDRPVAGGQSDPSPGDVDRPGANRGRGIPCAPAPTATAG